MQLMLRFEKAVSDILQNQGTLPETLNNILTKFDLHSHKLSQQTKQGALSNYFTIEIKDSEQASAIVESLRICQGVEAAYIKPSEEIPLNQ